MKYNPRARPSTPTLWNICCKLKPLKILTVKKGHEKKLKAIL